MLVWCFLWLRNGRVAGRRRIGISHLTLNTIRFPTSSLRFRKHVSTLATIIGKRPWEKWAVAAAAPWRSEPVRAWERRRRIFYRIIETARGQTIGDSCVKIWLVGSQGRMSCLHICASMIKVTPFNRFRSYLAIASKRLGKWELKWEATHVSISSVNSIRYGMVYWKFC